MAGALYQDWENYNPNNPTALRPPSYWDAVKQNLPHALRGFQRMPTNVMGFPVDMVNLAVGAEKPFLGSEYLAEKLNVPERTGHPTELGTEIASEFLLPTAQGLGRSALKAEEFLGKTFKEKLPEVVGKHVPEPFRTPISGLNIKPKDSALSPSLTKEVVSGDKYFTDEALKLGEADNYKSRLTITYMSPDEFLTLAEKGTDKGKTKKVSELIESDTKFENLPLIDFTHDGKGMAQVVGHEGRHRMRALKELGVTKVPVRFNSQGKKSIRWGQQDDLDSYDYIPPKERPTQIKSEDGDVVLPMFDSDVFPIYSPKEAIVTKQAPKAKDFPNEVKSLKGEPVKKINEVRQKIKPNPYVAYHSTKAEFNEFDPDMGVGGQMWFTSKKDLAEKGYEGAQSGRLVKAELDIRNPAGRAEYEKYGIDELMGMGYDGIKLDDGDDIVSVAFFPEQVKINYNKPIQK
jgi:hypothetical protein